MSRVATKTRVQVMIELIKNHNLKSYCEVGVKQGRMLLAVVGSTGVQGIGVDAWRNIPNEGESYDEWNFDAIKAEYDQNAGAHPNIRTIHDTSLNAAKLVDQVDLVFIDAGHDYKNAHADILAWRPKCKIISGHDYDPRFPGVMRAVDELVPERTLASNSCWWAIA